MNQKKLSPDDIGARIHHLREERGLSMRELASMADVTASLISKIEAGKLSPTVASLQKITSAMDVDIYEFFRSPVEEKPTDLVVFRSDEMAISEDRERRWSYVFPRHPDVRLQLTYEEYQPHTRKVERETHKKDIAGLIISGTLTLEVANKGTFSVNKGDAFYIKAGQLHCAHNDTDEVVCLVTTTSR